MYPYYSTARQVPTHPAIVSRNGTQDERLFPLLPFVAGLAIGPLLFNRPNYYPPYPPVMYPYPYPSPYPVYQGYPGGLGPGYYPQTYGAQPGITENINIYS
jgi:hypothetical protein